MASVSKNEDKRRFELPLEGGKVAFVDYVEKGDGVIDLAHTEVPAEFEGKGIGGQLLKGALDLAKQDGRRIEASCAFAAAYLKRHPQSE